MFVVSGLLGFSLETLELTLLPGISNIAPDNVSTVQKVNRQLINKRSLRPPRLCGEKYYSYDVTVIKDMSTKSIAI